MSVRVPNSVIGTEIANDKSDWNECYPVVRDGIIIAAVDQDGNVLFGESVESTYDSDLDYFVANKLD